MMMRPVIVRLIAFAVLALPAATLIAQDHGLSDTVQPVITRIPSGIRQFSVDGVKVILRPTGEMNRVVAVKLYIRGGLSVLPKDVSPAVEPLALDVPILSGPQGMDKGEYRRVVDRMVTKIDASTGRDFSTVDMRCVDEQFDESWRLFAGILMHPQFEETELRNAKQRAIIGIRNRLISPESYCEFIADSIFFSGHPYGRYARETDFGSINEASLHSYLRNMLVKSRLLLVVVGNVDSTDLHNKLKSSLATLPEGSYEEFPIPVPRNANKPSLVVLPPIGGQPATTNYIVARYLTPNRSDALYFPMLRLTSFLSGSLFREIRIERNLSYAPDADVSFGRTSYGQITISTTLPDSAWRVARHEVVDFFRDYVIGDEYMQGGIASWTANTFVKQQTSASQANELGLAEIYTGSWKNAFGTVEGMKGVTPEGMNKAAQRSLRNFTIVIIGNPKSVTRKEFESPPEGDGRGKPNRTGKVSD